MLDFIDALVKAGMLSASVESDGFIGSTLFVFNGLSASGQGSATVRFFNSLAGGTVGQSLKGHELSTSEPQSLVATVRDSRGKANTPQLYANIFVNNTGVTPTGTGTAGSVSIHVQAYANSTGLAVGTPLDTAIGVGQTVGISDVLASLKIPAGGGHGARVRHGDFGHVRHRRGLRRGGPDDPRRHDDRHESRGLLVRRGAASRALRVLAAFGWLAFPAVAAAAGLDCSARQVLVEPKFVQANTTANRVLGVHWGLNGSFVAADGQQDGLVFLNTAGAQTGFQPLNLFPFNLTTAYGRLYFQALDSSGRSVIAYTSGSTLVQQFLPNNFLSQGGLLTVGPDGSGVSYSNALSSLLRHDKSLVLSPLSVVSLPGRPAAIATRNGAP